jgi:hypothetical protein
MDTTTPPSSTGVDIGKEVFHIVCFGTDEHRRHDGVPKRVLSQPGSASARPRAADHSIDL